MPRQYSPDTRKRACGYYMSGLTFDEIARKMRGEDYPYLNAETIRRWAEKGNWSEDREKLRADDARVALTLDADRFSADMLDSYNQLHDDVRAAMADGRLELGEGVKLLLPIDTLRRQLLNQVTNRQSASIDKPALWLEFMGDLINDLAELDPGALEALDQHMEAIKERAKARFAAEAA